jgi:hypothetical protein
LHITPPNRIKLAIARGVVVRLQPYGSLGLFFGSVTTHNSISQHWLWGLFFFFFFLLLFCDFFSQMGAPYKFSSFAVGIGCRALCGVLTNIAGGSVRSSWPNGIFLSPIVANSSLNFQRLSAWQEPRKLRKYVPSVART